MGRRVVLDTNVVVAALRSRRGSSAAVLLGAGTGRFEFCISVALFLEYEDVLKRPESGVRLPLDAIDDILDHLAAVGRHQTIFFLWRPRSLTLPMTLCWRWPLLAAAMRL